MANVPTPESPPRPSDFPSPNSAQRPLPATVAWLGYGGLVPFIVLAAVVAGGGVTGGGLVLTADRALVDYGAVILSFVGALHWAFAMTLPKLGEPRRRAAFMWSVVPALLAWVGLLLAPTLGAALMIVGFLAQYAQDRNLSKGGTLPGWYLPLRLRLTCIASVCLAVAVFATQQASR